MPDGMQPTDLHTKHSERGGLWFDGVTSEGLGRKLHKGWGDPAQALTWEPMYHASLTIGPWDLGLQGGMHAEIPS